MGVDNLASYGPTVFPQFMGLSSIATTIIASGITASMMLSCMNSIFGISLGNITNVYVLAREKLIGGETFLTKTNKNNRPTVTAFVHAIFLWLLLAFISSETVLAAFTNLGVIAAFVLTITAVFLRQKQQSNYLQMLIALLGFCSCAVLTYFSWFKVGSDHMERIINITPLIVGTILGLIFYKIQQSKKISIAINQGK
jgi:amino acid transporter